MAINNVKPFELLSEYERLSLLHKVQSKDAKIVDQWSGVGFSIGDTQYVIPIDKIVEVLILTETTKIPGISAWVLGLGNIRGNLIPVVDLKGYLLNQSTKTTAHTRMVVINQVGGQVGLVVDEVYGQKHFVKKQLQKTTKKKKEDLKYNDTSYKDENGIWNVLEVDMLINDSAFQNAAAV